MHTRSRRRPLLLSTVALLVLTLMSSLSFRGVAAQLGKSRERVVV